jgi:hypothetical protein
MTTVELNIPRAERKNDPSVVVKQAEAKLLAMLNL